MHRANVRFTRRLGCRGSRLLEVHPPSPTTVAFRDRDGSTLLCEIVLDPDVLVSVSGAASRCSCSTQTGPSGNNIPRKQSRAHDTEIISQISRER
jgi:hypothetical protein